MDSLELSKNMLRHHVIQPLNVYDHMIELLEGYAGASNPGVLKLKKEHTWRHLGPPLFTYSLTALEVFLENFFLERYQKPGGEKYENKKELGNDIADFCKRHEIEKMSRNISFQRMKDAATLYEAAFGIKFNDYDEYSLIELQFTKRHLFTHRGGLLDEKFIEEYNQFHERNGDTEKLIDRKNVGKIALLERSWVRESTAAIERFIDYIASNDAFNPDAQKSRAR